MSSLTDPGETREGSAVRVGDRDCAHRMHVVGYVHRSPQTRTDCQQPLRSVCLNGCGHQTFWRCDCSDSSKCADCSERRRKLIARLVDMGATDRLGAGYTYFLTLTAPGTEAHRRWRQGKGGNDRPVCDCHDNGLSLGDWNAQESACWNRLRLALSRLSQGSLTYIGSVEVQARGALHRHLVVNLDRPLLPEEVQALAMVAGYGCVFDLQPIRSAGKAAWYISKYVTKSAGDRKGVPWIADVVDQETGEVRRLHTRATFRTWSSAQSWGYTLKGLREIARAQAQARARYLLELREALAADAGSLAPATATAIDRAGPAPG